LGGLYGSGRHKPRDHTGNSKGRVLLRPVL